MYCYLDIFFRSDISTFTATNRKRPGFRYRVLRLQVCHRGKLEREERRWRKQRCQRMVRQQQRRHRRRQRQKRNRRRVQNQNHEIKKVQGSQVLLLLQVRLQRPQIRFLLLFSLQLYISSNNNNNFNSNNNNNNNRYNKVQSLPGRQYNKINNQRQ